MSANEENEKLSTLVVETSFGMKLKPEDKERTTINFSLDFSSLSREELAVYAAREVSRDVNNSVRDGKKKLEEVQNQIITVKPFEKGERGKAAVTEAKALEKLALTYGISIEALAAKLAEMKGAVK